MRKIMILLFSILSFIYSPKIFSQPGKGDAAPVISGLEIIDNEMPNLKNKFVFIHFWATWCGSEDQSLKHLSLLAERYKNKVVFLAISEQNEEQVRSFLQGKQYYNIFFGLDDGQTQKKYSISDLPCFCFISPDNIVLAKGSFSSDISDHDLDSLIIINDSTVLPNTTNLMYHKSMNRGGRILIQDSIMNNDRTQPTQKMIFAKNMLVGIETGYWFKKLVVTEIALETSFKHITRIEIESGLSQMMVQNT